MPPRKAVDRKVQESRIKLITFIDCLPKLQFTSGDITDYIGTRPTYKKAWNIIRNEGIVERISLVRGKLTTWKRSKLIYPPGNGINGN